MKSTDSAKLFVSMPENNPLKNRKMNHKYFMKIDLCKRIRQSTYDTKH